MKTGNEAFLAERMQLRDFAVEQCSNKDQETFEKFPLKKIPNVLSRSQAHNTSVFFFSQPLNAPNYPRFLSPFQQDFDSIKESNV